MDLLPLPAALPGQLMGNPQVTLFLAGMFVGIAVCWVWDHYVLASLAHWWAYRVRSHRGR